MRFATARHLVGLRSEGNPTTNNKFDAIDRPKAETETYRSSLPVTGSTMAQNTVFSRPRRLGWPALRGVMPWYAQQAAARATKARRILLIAGAAVLQGVRYALPRW